MPITVPRRGVRHPPREGAPSSPADSEWDDAPEYSRPPGEAPELPDDLTDLDDVQLMELLTKLTRWHDFLAARLSRAEIAARRAEIAHNEAQADALVMAWGVVRQSKQDSVTVAKAQAAIDPKVQGAAQEALEKYAIRKRLEVRVEAFTDDAFVVSRELTRRTKMEPYDRRERRWGGS